MRTKASVQKNMFSLTLPSVPSCSSHSPSSKSTPPKLKCIYTTASLVAQTVKESACNVRDPGLISGSGRSTGEGNGNPRQYSCLGNPMDRGPWPDTIHGVAKSPTHLSDWDTQRNIYHGISPGHEQEGYPATCNNMDEPWRHYAKWNKPDRERQILYVVTLRIPESWTYGSMK